MNIANLIQYHAELFAEQDVHSWDLEPNEWNHVEKTFSYEGLEITMNVSVHVREPMFHQTHEDPASEWEYEFGDITITDIQVDYSLLD